MVHSNLELLTSDLKMNQPMHISFLPSHSIFIQLFITEYMSLPIWALNSLAMTFDLEASFEQKFKHFHRIFSQWLHIKLYNVTTWLCRSHLPLVRLSNRRIYFSSSIWHGNRRSLIFRHWWSWLTIMRHKPWFYTSSKQLINRILIHSQDILTLTQTNDDTQHHI